MSSPLQAVASNDAGTIERVGNLLDQEIQKYPDGSKESKALQDFKEVLGAMEES